MSHPVSQKPFHKLSVQSVELGPDCGALSSSKGPSVSKRAREDFVWSSIKKPRQGSVRVNVPRVIHAGCRGRGGARSSQATTLVCDPTKGRRPRRPPPHRSPYSLTPLDHLLSSARPTRVQNPLDQEPVAVTGPRLGPLPPAGLQRRPRDGLCQPDRNVSVSLR